MAALRDIARDFAAEIRDGIGWTIVYRTGRSWNALTIWSDIWNGEWETNDLNDAIGILKADPDAVIVNGYYCGHFGEDMTIDEITAGLTEMVNKQLADGKAKFPEVPTEVRVVRGRAEVALVDESKKAGLVVVGSRGRGGFAGLLLNWPLVPGLGLVDAAWLPGLNGLPCSWGIWFVYAGLALGLVTTAYYIAAALRKLPTRQSFPDTTIPYHVAAFSLFHPRAEHESRYWRLC